MKLLAESPYIEEIGISLLEQPRAQVDISVFNMFDVGGFFQKVVDESITSIVAPSELVIPILRWEEWRQQMKHEELLQEGQKTKSWLRSYFYPTSQDKTS